MKIALVQAPVWWTLDPPLGLAQIAGCAKSAGHDVSIHDLNIVLWSRRAPQYENMWLWEQFQFWNDPQIVSRFFQDNAAAIEDELEKILVSDAEVVGFSVCLGSQWASLEFSRLIKKADPSRIVVWGGQFFFKGDAAERWILNPEIDAVVRGPGDLVFERIIQDVERTGAVGALPGVVTKSGGKAVSGGPALPIRDLDEVPFMHLSGFPLDLYVDSDRIPFIASRGCVWKCHFCSSTQFWTGYSYMSGDRIFAEIRYHKNHLPQKGHVDFYDITANGNVESLRRLSERVVQNHVRRDGVGFGWKINAIIRPEMTREIFSLMQEAGCKEIIYGIESGSPGVLRRMNKPFDPNVARRVLSSTHDAGITTAANFMFGYPGETEDDFGMTLDFIKENARSLDRVYASATLTNLEERSYLTGHRREMGVKEEPAERFHNLYWETAAGNNTYDVRLDRYWRFRELAISLGIDAYKGIDGDLKQEHSINLARYKRYRRDYMGSIRHYADFLENDPMSAPVRSEFSALGSYLGKIALAQEFLERANRLLDESGTSSHDFVSWVQVETCLRRARQALAEFSSGEGAVVHLSDGRFSLLWGKSEIPSLENVLALHRRMARPIAAQRS
ncbi:MAG: B12-binding domain-containing radical SAM protein [Elusimicrobiota bacterium]